MGLRCLFADNAIMQKEVVKMTFARLAPAAALGVITLTTGTTLAGAAGGGYDSSAAVPGGVPGRGSPRLPSPARCLREAALCGSTSAG